jgi:hypothetical protein
VSDVNYDAWREVVNGPETYVTLASILRNEGKVVVGWTDGAGSHHDVLFTLCPRKFGSLGGGLRGSTDLFVSLMRHGCFGFDIATTSPRHPDYIAEKLGTHQNETIERLSELINGVCGSLQQRALT